MKRLMTLALMALLLALTLSAQGNRVYIEDFEIEPGATDSVLVLLSNVDPSRGLQFNLSLPQGLEICEYDLTDYSRRSKMHLLCEVSTKDSCYVAFIYPMGLICYPADDAAAVMYLKVKASKGFKGGNIVTWKCCGATMENTTINMDGASTRVTVPDAALVGIPVDTQSADDRFFGPDD